MRFVGRRKELAELRRLIDELGLVLVVGEAGVGKTTLVRELVAERGDDLLVVDGVTSIPRTPERRPAVAISRRLVPGWEGGVLHLKGLDRVEAMELWGVADERSGSRRGFVGAFRRSGGNPALLLAAHEGMPGDPEADALVAGLADAERQVALRFALSPSPLPLDDGHDAEPGRALVQKLVIEACGAGIWKLAERYRVPLRAVASPEELARARARVDALLPEVAARLASAPAHIYDEGARTL